MLAALEEAIIRIEGRGDGDRLVQRLRALQEDIATALGLDDPGSKRRPGRRTNYYGPLPTVSLTLKPFARFLALALGD
jgi:hypothetical protein